MENTIAVVIPAYNASRTIKRTLDSLKNQTVPPDQVIVVDDYSDDNTYEIVKKYKMKNLSLVKNEKNVGTYHTVRNGVETVKCDYIVKLDSDDELTLGFIEYVKKVLSNFQYDYVSMPMFRIDLNGNILKLHNGSVILDGEPTVDIKSIDNCLDIFFSQTLPWYVTSTVVKTQIWRQSFDASIPEKIVLDDVFLSMKMHALSKSYYYCPKSNEGYRYYFSIGYWSSTKDSISLDWFVKNVNMRVLQYHNNANFLKSNGFDNKYVNLLYGKCDIQSLFSLVTLLPVKNIPEALNILNKNFILFPKN